MILSRLYWILLVGFLFISSLSYGQEKQDTAQIMAYLDSAYAITYEQNLPARALIFQALELARQSNYANGIRKAHYLLGLNYLAGSHLDSALIYSQEAVSLTEKMEGSKLQLIDSYNLLANVYDNSSKVDSALATYLKAMRIAEEVNDTISIGMIAFNASNLYKYQNNQEQQVVYLDRAIHVFRQLKQESYLANAYTSKILTVKQRDSADYYTNRAIAIYNKTENTFGLAHVYNAIALFHLQDQDFRNALKYYEQSSEIFERYGVANQEANAARGIGLAYAGLGDNTKAIEYIRQSLKKDQSREIGRESIKSYYSISELFFKEKIYDSAYIYMTKYDTLRDKVFNLEMTQRNQQLQIAYETEAKERQLVESRLKITEEKNKKNTALGFGLLMSVLIGGGGYWFYNRQRNSRLAAEANLRISKNEKEQLEKLDQFKNRFFSNISHEFRTPITMILGPLQEMIDGGFKGDLVTYYKIMHRNAERVLKLVNELLDLSRLEDGKVNLTVSKIDPDRFIKSQAALFESILIERNIKLEINNSTNTTNLWVDVNNFEKVISNLISNAIKYSRDSSLIKLVINEHDKFVEFVIEDEGIGIASEEAKYIFDRFYRSTGEHNKESVGTGIGLALAKELVELHQGKIEYIPASEGGSIFKIQLLKGNSHFNPDQLDNQKFEYSSLHEEEVIATDNSVEDQFKLLIVEDNQDVRTFIKDAFIDSFQVIEASDGLEGLEIAQEVIPDIIISDVMMPSMDGIDFTKAIREKELTSHIPIIMLTAKSEQSEKMVGLESGVDAYMTKPFDRRELMVRVENLISQRKKQIAKYKILVSSKPSKITAPSVDDQFLSKLKLVVEGNMEDEGFGVAILCKKMMISHSQLKRKIKALLNMSPSIFIRKMKLQRAYDLLEQNAGNASEIAYQLCFSNPAYFSTCFKEEYGLTPSQLRQESQKK